MNLQQNFARLRRTSPSSRHAQFRMDSDQWLARWEPRDIATQSSSLAYVVDVCKNGMTETNPVLVLRHSDHQVGFFELPKFTRSWTNPWKNCNSKIFRIRKVTRYFDCWMNSCDGAYWPKISYRYWFMSLFQKSYSLTQIGMNDRY